MIDLIESIWLDEHLEKATPYMLRNDGVLLKCGGAVKMHPYIICDINRTLGDSLYDTSWNDVAFFNTNRNWMVNWFYDNTQYTDTKILIEEIIKSILNIEPSLVEDEWVQNFNITNKTNYTTDTSELVELITDVNNRTNQEFLRLRTSHMKYGGDSGDLYCRVSSNNFNWYPLLVEVVMENEKFLESITISNDPQSTGGKIKYYVVDGKEVKDMSVEDFIMLKGKPIIEKYKTNSILADTVKSFMSGHSFDETFYDIHSRYVNEYYRHLNEDWIRNNYE